MTTLRKHLTALGAVLLAGLQPALCNPTGADVVSGTANISTNGNTMTVVNSNGAIINWQEFSIQAGETTKFIQPDANSAVLNRVVGTNLSEIYGTLSSNGKVFLINPNGIFVGAGAVINTAGFLASTLDVSNEEFRANNGSGTMHFTGTSTAAITNLGTIKTVGGDVVLLAERVINGGSISASAGSAGRGGNVVLGGGTDVYLTTSSRDGTYIRAASGKGQIVNTGTIEAVNAQLNAVGGNEYALAINNSGTIRATGITRRGGHVYLLSSGSTVSNSGQIVAKRADGAGGTVAVKGATTLNSGSIDVSSTVSVGGRVILSGQDVALYSGGSINASGATGGGTVLIGGGAHGADPFVLNSQATYVGSGTAINADATLSGNGGTVVVWSDGTTRFYGTISAKGAGGGAGGWVETSGHTLVAQGGVTTGGGTWLLDPTDVVIGDGYSDSVSYADSTSYDFSTASNTSYISTSSLFSALDGNNVEVTASGGITVDSSNNAGITGGHTLTLTAAGGDITIGSSDWEGDFGLILNAGGGIAITGTTINASGVVSLTAATSIYSDGGISAGSLSANGPASVELGGVVGNSVTITGGTVQIDSTTTCGDLTINATSDVTTGEIDGTGRVSLSSSSGQINVGDIGASVVSLSAASDINTSVITSSGAVTLTTDYGTINLLQATVGDGLTVTSNSGDINLAQFYGADISVGAGLTVSTAGNVTLNGGNVSAIGASSISSTAGTVTMTGAVHGNVDPSLSVGSGDLSINGAAGISLINYSVSSDSSLTMTSLGTISVANGFTSGSTSSVTAGSISLVGSAINADGNLNVTTTSGDITLSPYNGTRRSISGIHSGAAGVGQLVINVAGTLDFGGSMFFPPSSNTGAAISSYDGSVSISAGTITGGTGLGSGTVSATSGSITVTTTSAYNPSGTIRFTADGHVTIASASTVTLAGTTYSTPTLGVGGISSANLAGSQYAAILPNGSRVLSVSVGNGTSVVGTVPSLAGVTESASGLTSGDTLASLGLNGLTSTVSASSPTGTYAITVAGASSGDVLGSYALWIEDGTFTVGAAPVIPVSTGSPFVAAPVLPFSALPFKEEAIPSRLDRTQDGGLILVYANRADTEGVPAYSLGAVADQGPSVAFVNALVADQIGSGHDDANPAPRKKASGLKANARLDANGLHVFVHRPDSDDETVVGPGRYEITAKGPKAAPEDAGVTWKAVARAPLASEIDSMNPGKLVAAPLGSL